ncbi:MAG TPA: 4-hydroxythreonine-4-phosphate dehydrogenase PdxA [Dissulfurispiraceae bacterium]|nr:4-hydroxythreonine-4-phosphate dehydrogenase PdxA [Dissulfurispiraceae bacterium]
MKKRIAITLGDPGGVGAEVTLKSLRAVAGITRPLLIGDKPVIESACEMLGIELDIGLCDFIGTGAIPTFAFTRNAPSAEGGHASVSYIRKAVELAKAKAIDAIVTAPISKESLKMAGYAWPGHTEMLAELTGTQHYAMMLCGGPIRVILVTIHTALRNVPALITADRVLETIRLAKKACGMLGLAEPRIAVAGLNPHAGEAGIFGDEEQTSIFPAIAAAEAEGVAVAGPFPPDTLFHRVYKGEFDIVVCMYHDQGLIPLKMIAFDSGVNVTVGLPIIRTSPDHGTAYDISWKGEANPSSMIEAIKFAARLQKK